MHFTSPGKGEGMQTADLSACGSQFLKMTGSIHLPTVSELKQSMENTELIFCPRTLIAGTEHCLLFAGLFSGIYTLLIFSKVYLQMLQTEKLSFMQFIILTLSSRASFFKQTAAAWVWDNWFKKKKKGSFIIQIHFSDGKDSDPFLWLATAIYPWAEIHTAKDARRKAPELYCCRKRTKLMVLKRWFLHTYQNTMLC